MLDFLTNGTVLGAIDGMSNLIDTGKSVLHWAQRLALIGAAIAFCIGGYMLMFGGERGRHKSLTWFIGGAVGLIVVMGCYALAQGVNNNVHFGG